jgi:hypothetical protein
LRISSIEKARMNFIFTLPNDCTLGMNLLIGSGPSASMIMAASCGPPDVEDVFHLDAQLSRLGFGRLGSIRRVFDCTPALICPIY